MFKIESILNSHNACKIGKTSDIKNRFDKYYQDAGFVGIKPICQSNNKKVIDELEEDLITHFGNRVLNIQVGGGNKSYTGDYWIYVAVR